MYSIFESVINRGGYKLGDMLNRIKTYAAEGKLTIEEMEKLEALAREKANMQDGTDMLGMLLEHEQRLRKLEAAMPVEPVDPDAPTEAPEYEPGKWYYAGDVVTFEGKTYTCIAPEGVVCVWSPAEFPTYWQVIE
jgi:hypothetical protein